MYRLQSPKQCKPSMKEAVAPPPKLAKNHLEAQSLGRMTLHWGHIHSRYIQAAPQTAWSFLEPHFVPQKKMGKIIMSGAQAAV